MEEKASNFEILAKRENQELFACEQNIQLFRRYIQDYESLAKRLETLPDRTRHDIMVPIGGTKLAFMPGYIHHTNEILVLLGDNYFAEKSAKETIEFSRRRIDFCRQRLAELEKQRKMLEKWLQTSVTLRNEAGEFVEITETCTEEEYQKMIRERKSVQLPPTTTNDNSAPETKKPKMDLDAFFAKYQDDDDDITDKMADDRMPVKEVLEKDDPKPPPPTPTPAAYQRPVSKFKASRQLNR